MDTNLIYRGDCYAVLKRKFPSNSIDLIYLDPPFSFDPKYARLWYDKESLEMFDEIRKGDIKHFVSWMSKRLEQCHRALKETGSMYLHCDWKFGHYLKVEMDNIFGRNNFRNEIIWCYSIGGKSKKMFGRKHDTIFFYTKGKEYVFNEKDIRIPRKPKTHMKLGRDPNGREFQEKKDPKTGKVYRYYVDEGKIPEDYWLDIETLNREDRERIGYPTQKPTKLLERIIKASSKQDDIVLDPMCGCGTTIEVAYQLGREWIGIDIAYKACEEMKKRMEALDGITEVEVKGLSMTIRDLKKLKPFDFEEYICEMTNSQQTSRVGDKGIDGYYLGEVPIQIKKQDRVGRNTVDNFETALRRKGKDKGCIIGFSFTSNAHEEVARAKDDEFDIRLVEVKELIRKDYELGDLMLD
jgi:DNA modification methylase